MACVLLLIKVSILVNQKKINLNPELNSGLGTNTGIVAAESFGYLVTGLFIFSCYFPLLLPDFLLIPILSVDNQNCSNWEK